MTEESCLVVRDGEVVSYVGPGAVAVFQALTLARALLLYADTKLRVNRAYTPTAMLQAASRITGKAYKRGAYRQAAEDVRQWAAQMRAALPVREGNS